MSIKLGSNDINKIMLGADEVPKMYLGSDLIYENVADTWVAEGTNFDGSSSWLQSNTFTGTASPDFLLSMWIWVDSTDDRTMYPIELYHGGQWIIAVEISPSIYGSKASVFTKSQSGSILYFNEGVIVVADQSWHHILVSTSASSTHMYVDNIDDNAPVYSPNGQSIEYSPDLVGIGSQASGDNKLNGDLSEVYITNEYLDLSILANREKFINSGVPVELGVDGSIPTGTQPLLYFKSFNDFSQGINAGSAGNFNVNGALTRSTNEPVQLP